MTRTNLPLDETTKYLVYSSVARGQQMMIHLEDCGSIVVIVNPADKRKPYVYYAEGEINNFNQIAATTPEEEQDAIPTG